MFPDYEPTISIDSTTAETTSNGKSFFFDFTTGDFVVKDGKVQTVEGIEALKIWIQKVLKTEKFKFKIYETGETDEYGVTLLNLVNSGHPQMFIQAEIQREITDTLVKNIEILSVDNFSFSREKRILVVGFSVNSTYGTTDEEVSF
ncbi:MAG TPA: DUF2634 domain-containing protein [Ruminiclostridium sp.]